MKKKWIIAVLLIFIVVIVVPIIINTLYLVDDGYITVWSGADVLSFYGSTLGALGAIALGVVAWEQNKRLLKMEERSFLSENLSRLLILELQISGFDRMACNLNLHGEQIVTSDKENYFDSLKCHSFTLTFTIETIENYPALLRIDRIILKVTEKGDTGCICIDAENISEEYSLIAMSQKGFAFDCTCIVPIETYETLQELVKRQGTVSASVDLRTITVKHICTRWRLAATLLFLGSAEKGVFDFKVKSSVPAICFWLDSVSVTREKIKIKRVDELDNRMTAPKN